MKLRKKGFTLIELMIVLAVIAILAIVLVPKIGSTKKEARNTGVTTNARAVQSYLEGKLDSYTNFPAADALATALTTNFSNDSNMVNPFSKSSSCTSAAASSAPCVFVTTDTTTTASSTYKGSVIVIIDSANKAFHIIGVDGDGGQLSTTDVK